MSGGTRLAAFAALVAAVVVAAFAVGRVADVDIGAASESHGHDETASEHETGGHDEGGSAAESEASSPGLVADGGLRLVVEQTQLQPGVEQPYAFRIVDVDGHAVEDYDVAHDARMHVIVARRDLGTYQHVHPKQVADGSWTVPLRLDEPGVYRVFADFTTNGTRATLGADVFVPGAFTPRPLPAPTDAATTGAYAVRLATTTDGHGETVEFTVLRDGRPVENLEPYLGAKGHLVALREGDLSFLHVHPVEGEIGPDRISFAVDYPSAGAYRLFLQFKHEGRVQTVAFTRNVER